MEFEFTRTDTALEGGSDAAAAVAPSTLPAALAEKLHTHLRLQAEQEIEQMRGTFWWTVFAAFMLLLVVWNWPFPSPAKKKGTAAAADKKLVEAEEDKEEENAKVAAAAVVVKASWKEPTRAPASTKWRPVTLLDPITLR